jgi:protocatechuate 3,4-dioxygenase beta subunit
MAARGPDRTDRRLVLRGLGGLGVMALFDCGGVGATRSAGSAEGGAGSVDAPAGAPDGATCVLDPTLTKGPYWIDERLERSDLVPDTNNLASPNPPPGLPLTLRIAVVANATGGCTPLPGAQVDVWHCDATGRYSDTAALGTAGETFLRGFQRTDASGQVTFTTLYPGWYAGRSVHIHVKVRMFDAASNVTTEATTQVFFDDSVNDHVGQVASPYMARGVPDTSNAMDGYYANNTELLLSLSGDAVSGYVGSITLGIALGAIAQG